MGVPNYRATRVGDCSADHATNDSISTSSTKSAPLFQEKTQSSISRGDDQIVQA